MKKVIKLTIMAISAMQVSSQACDADFNDFISCSSTFDFNATWYELLENYATYGSGNVFSVPIDPGN